MYVYHRGVSYMFANLTLITLIKVLTVTLTLITKPNNILSFPNVNDIHLLKHFFKTDVIHLFEGVTVALAH